MSYSRLPATTRAGVGMTQTPTNTNINNSLSPVTLNSDISTTGSLGIVQVGSGLSITQQGVLSATTSSSLFAVKIVTANYIVVANDYYIGAIKKDITITLPIGVTGKVYVVKNEENGEITVTGTAGQKIDGSVSEKLSTNKSLMVIFNGTEWQSIATNNS
jgi:hypothetical protein